MAPKVCVPADFGRHHIGAPSHGNLTFNLREGVQIKANSIILSLNSPIIDDLTTDLHLTSLEADDFSREAVDCFIEASYTGEVEALNVGNFRDVNKMGHVFKVDWLVAKCEDYFVKYLDKLDDASSYPDILFAAEEAEYLMSALKKQVLLNLVVRKIRLVFSSAVRDNFITKYLSDFGTCSKIKIDVSIAIVKEDLIHKLIDILMTHLDNQGHKSLDDNSRYLLKNIDNLTVCFGNHPEVHAKLFTTLECIENVEKEDYRLFLALSKQLSQPQNKSPVIELDLLISSNDFRKNTKFYTVFCKLASNPKVDNLYQFFDGLWSRLYQEGNYVVPEDLSEKIIAVKGERGWNQLNKEYVENIMTDEHLQLLIDPVELSDEIVFEPDEAGCIEFSDFITAEDFVAKYFCQNSSFEFELSDTDYADIKFVFSTTAMLEEKPETFSMKLELLDPKLNTSYRMPRLHIALETIYTDHNNYKEIIPISWCGYPICNKAKTWRWGHIVFLEQQKDKSDEIGSKNESKDESAVYVYNIQNDMKCRLVAFHVDCAIPINL